MESRPQPVHHTRAGPANVVILRTSKVDGRNDVTRSAIFLLTSTSRKPAFNARSCPRRYERKETVDIAPPPSLTAAKTFPDRYSPIMAKQVIDQGVSAASLRCSSMECAHRLWRRHLYVSKRLVCRKCYINIKYVLPVCFVALINDR